MTAGVLWLFLTASWVGLQCVIVVFSGHTHLLLDITWSCCDSQIFLPWNFTKEL